MSSQFVLFEEEFTQLVAACTGLRESASAKAVFLIDKNGQLLASSGDTGNLDTTSLATLTAGNMAATDGLARVLGEKGFGIQFHEGETENVHISVVDTRMILVVLFDQRSSLGLVRLRVRQATEELVRILASMTSESSEGSASLFDEISDDDIDHLFGKK